MHKLKLAKKIYGIITGHPTIVTFWLGITLAALISTAIGIADPHNAMASGPITTGGDGGQN